MWKQRVNNLFAVIGAGWLVYKIYMEFFAQHRLIQPEISAQGVRALVKQTARWSLASQQDENPVVAMLHANYGVGYWSALRSLATMDMIGRLSKANPVALETRVLNAQAAATRKVIEACPALAPQDWVLARAAHGTLS